MSTTQITQITNGLRPLLEYVDLDLNEDELILFEVETIAPCFGFDRGKTFEQVSINIADGTLQLIDEDCVYRGRVTITLPDQLDEFPREDAEAADEPDEEDGEEALDA